MKKQLRLLLANLCLVLTSFGISIAQMAVPLPLDDALRTLRFASLMPIALSPDGNWLAYTVQNNQKAKSTNTEAYLRTGVPPWASGTDIYLMRMATGATRLLTNGEGDNWQPAWSPDSHYLAFLSTRDSSGQARLWTWDARKNELRKVSDISVRASEIEWTRDGQRLLVTTLPEGPNPERSSSAGDRQQSGNIANASTVILYRSDKASDEILAESNPWDLNVYLRDLTLVDVTRGTATVVVHGERIATYAASPQGSAVAFTVPKKFERPGSQQILFDLVVVELSTLKTRLIASDIRLGLDGASFSWSPDSLHLAYCTGGPEERASNCYLVDSRGGVARNITDFPPAVPPGGSSSSPVWHTTGYVYFLKDGGLWRTSIADNKPEEVCRIPERQITHLITSEKAVLWTTERGVSTVVVTHDDARKQDGFYGINLVSGEGRKLHEESRCYTCSNVEHEFTVTPGGQELLYFAEDAQHDEDLWISDASFRGPRQLTHLNPQFDPITMGAARLIDWLGADGERLHGALLLPSDFDQNRRYPLIVWIYGGQFLSNQLNQFGLAGPSLFNMQLLATRGYAVLLPDAPQHRGTPMSDLAKSILPGVNKVIEMGVADPHHLGLIGHSYGGYSVLSLIVQTPRFGAAIEIDGYGDAIASYGAMRKDGTAFGIAIQERGQGLMGGNPWQLRDTYIENSPIFYFDNISTPLLVVNGSNDLTAPPFLGDEVFVGLRRLGKEVQYAKYEGEGHSPLQWSYANQVDLCHRMIAWLDSHLKGQPTP